MDLHVPLPTSFSLNHFASQGELGILSPFPEDWPGKGPAGRKDFLRPRAAAFSPENRVPTQTGPNVGRPVDDLTAPTNRRAPGRAGDARAEAGTEGEVVTCGREGR